MTTKQWLYRVWQRPHAFFQSLQPLPRLRITVGDRRSAQESRTGNWMHYRPEL